MPPIIDKSKCQKCGLCAQICTMDVFGPVPADTIPEIRYPEECWHCRACVMDCPAHALSLRYPLPLMLLTLDVNSQNSSERKG